MADTRKESGAGIPAKGEPAQPEKKEKAKAPGRKKKKLFVVIGASLVVIAIAVVAGIFFFGNKNTTRAEAQGESEGKAEKESVGIVYPLEPFIVNIYDDDESRYLKIKVEFEIAGKEVNEELEARKAPVRDAILILLTTKTLQDIKDIRGKNLMRDEILATVNKILPPGKVTRVYFTDFVVQ